MCLRLYCDCDQIQVVIDVMVVICCYYFEVGGGDCCDVCGQFGWLWCVGYCLYDLCVDDGVVVVGVYVVQVWVMK